ncbi:MAG: ATP-binding protein [Candidatus Methylomirabilales bacterium]
MRLAAKLILWVLIPLLVVLIVLATVTLRREREVHQRDAWEQAERLALALAIPAAEALGRRAPGDLATIVKRTALDPERFGLAIYDPAGKPIQTWGLAADVARLDPEVPRALADQPHGRGVEETLNGTPVRTHTVALTAGGELLGALSLSFSLIEMQELLTHERDSFLGMLVVVSIVLSVLTVVTIRHLVGLPLERLMRRISSLGSGERLEAEQIAGRDEVAQLAREFNALTLRLEEARRRLLEESESARNVIQSITDGIIGVDRQCRILTWNRAMRERYGIPEGEVLHKNLFEAFPALDREGLRPEVERLLDGSAAEFTLRYFEHETLRRGRVVLNIRGAALRSATDEITGAVLAIEDVTDRVTLAQEVQQAEKLAVVGQLAAGIAHQIGTPLNVISGSAEYLMMESGDRRPQELEIIVAQTDRIAKLIRQLLNFARPAKIELAPLDLNHLLREVLGLVEHQVAKEQITIRLEPEDGLPAIAGDANQLEQAFLNIVINAWHAMPGGGTLTLRTRQADRPRKGGRPARPGVEAAISDTGTGIPPELMERIFDPFFTTKGVGKGTGLGLAISRRIVEDHHGSIAVATEVGRGTTFTIWLPAAEGTA